MIADAISMALGDYLSSKSENEFYLKEMKREEWEVENNPEGEKLEMLEIYKVPVLPKGSPKALSTMTLLRSLKHSPRTSRRG
jgi:hypothetical protein